MDFIVKLINVIFGTIFMVIIVATGYLVWGPTSASVVYKDGDRLDFVTYAGDTSPVEFITKLRSIASFHFDTIEGVGGARVW